ncbi:MAG: XRE family transcriptional regulator [Bacteroidales bacterium]|nr:XRE family transcriptional regulator [Bacteroidales bacterium]
MALIKTEKELRAILARIDELVPLTGEGVAEDDPKNLELNLLCELVAEYEDENVVLDASLEDKSSLLEVHQLV